MLNAYAVLRVVPGANRQQIRAAYVKLAKQLHPDRHGGDEGAKQRLQDVNQAYELLKDPQKRSAYDQLLAQGRGEVRRRRRSAAVVMATSFALTTAAAVALLSLNLFARQGGPQQAELDAHLVAFARDIIDPVAPGGVAPEGQVDAAAMDDTNPEQWSDDQQIPFHSSPGSRLKDSADRPAAGTLAMLRTPALEEPSPSSTDQPRAWVTYHNDRFGFALDYPADVFAPDDRGLGEFWRLFVSHDGQARLLVTAGFNTKGVALPAYRQSLMNGTYAAASLEYLPLRKTWFVLAGSWGDEMFYERATFACDGRVIHGWRLTYPLAARDFYRPIIEKIHLGYKHVRGAGKHCG